MTPEERRKNIATRLRAVHFRLVEAEAELFGEFAAAMKASPLLGEERTLSVSEHGKINTIAILIERADKELAALIVAMEKDPVK